MTVIAARRFSFSALEDKLVGQYPHKKNATRDSGRHRKLQTAAGKDRRYVSRSGGGGDVSQNGGFVKQLVPESWTPTKST